MSENYTGNISRLFSFCYERGYVEDPFSTNLAEMMGWYARSMFEENSQCLPEFGEVFPKYSDEEVEQFREVRNGFYNKRSK